MIQLVYVHCPVTATTEKAYQHWLPRIPAAMQQQVVRYHRKQDAYLCLFGKVLLSKAFQKLGLGDYSLAKVQAPALQKPFLPDSNIDFNIAHSGEYVAVAFSQDTTIGLDMEKRNPVDLEDFKSQMTEMEWNALRNTEHSEQAFYDWWTQKEAILKATGKGLSLSLQSIELQANQAVAEGRIWHLQSMDIHPDYSCHVASGKASAIAVENLTEQVFSTIF